MPHRITVVVLAFIIVLSGLVAHAQITNVANDTITPIEGVGHDYIKVMSETVNPANGGLNIHIDMPVAKSRGLTVPFSITYDSNNVHHLNQGIYNNWGTVSWYANASRLGQGGWAFALPYARVSSWTETVAVQTGIGSSGPIYAVYNCGNVANYVMQDLSGITHTLPMRARQGVNDPNNYCSASITSPGSDGKAEGFLPSYLGLNPPSITVTDDVGTVYKYSTFKPDGSTDPNSYAAMPDTIEDRNGNIATFSINASNAVIVTDTSGRTSISTSGFGPSGSTNSVNVSGETFQVTWRTVSANFSTQSVWAGNPGDPSNFDNCSPPPSASDSPTVVSQITLPNGKFYKFYYGNDVTPHAAATNPYGLVSEIDYPSGAWVLYSWKLNNTYNDARDYNELADFTGIYSQGCSICSDCPGVPSYCPGAVIDGCRYQYKTPVVASRKVSFGGSSPSLTQSFVYSTNWGSGSLPLTGWVSKTTTITTTDNATGKSASTTYSYKPINVYNPSGVVPSQIAVEQSENYSDWNGTQLRTITKDWQDQFDMILDQTTIPGGGSGISAQKQYAYITNNTYFKEPLETDEYDFGASSPNRKTVTTYQSFSGVPGASGSPGALAGVPCKVLTSDGSGNPVAETDYLYDGGSVVCGTPGSASTADLTVTLASGTHDETLYPAGPGTPRANVTSVIKWLNGGTSPTTTYSYDKTGHVISSTDACGNPNGGCADVNGSSHTTQYFYADAYTTLSAGQNVNYTPTNGATNALLTKIIDPLLHVATFKYDYTSSQLTSATDPNNQTTGYIYNDFFARPTQANAPDGGQTTVAYNDAAYNPSVNTPSVTTTKMITSGLSEVNIAAGDGLGHVVRTILNSDPDGADTADTTYDGFGRALTQSNLHRSGASPTDGTTTNTYDALGRTTSVLRPDNSAVSTTYDQINGNTICTTVSDETGKSRKSCSDGLGRLVQVFEDPSGVNYETDYAYDILGNLLTVNQKGTTPTNSTQWRTRTFTYDSLSRLLTASNPESGTIQYTYDANGNVASKVAPQPNQTGSSTVTTNYSYDVLNRLLGKSYVGMGTVGATYGYDGVAPTGCTPPSLADSYPTGRRTGMCDGSGAASWSHDKMGRVLTESRKVNGFTRNISYTYNLDGSLATLTYPSGRVVTYTPGGAGRPTAVADSTGPINYAQGVHYAPFGALTDMTQGATPITIKNRYSPRLQPVLLSAYTASATIMSVCYDFHSKVALPSTNFAPCSFTASTLGDNGNVYQIVNNRDSNRTQNFMYDSLNRIQQAYSSGPNWGETYSSTATAPGVTPPTSGIDAWGNMTNHTGVTGKTTTEGTFNCPANTNNQLTTCGLTYDAAGNAYINNGVTYTYDAENRLVTPGAGNGTYLYDGDGNRMARLFSSSGTEYWRDLSGNPLLEDSNTGIDLREYIYFNGKKIARRDVRTNTVHFMFSDNLGSTSLVTDALGTMATCNGHVSGQFESDYFPYGGEMSLCNNLGDQNYKFTGKERDSESGLDMFGARYDASSMGRFMTPDPMMASAKVWNPQSWNRYAYALNNPLKYIDPTGMNEVTADQCQKDPKCVTVKVNVIYDKNANDGKGLTDKQKSDFEKGQLQSAKDQYGNANIHLDVTYTAGSMQTENGKTTISGLQAGSLNVVVTDQVMTAGSAMAGKTAVSFINPNSNDLAHEMAHQFMGDTQGWRAWVMGHDPIITGTILNAITDIGNDTERAWMRNIDQHSGPLSYYPLASAFHHNAATFQKMIQPTTKPDQQ